LNRIGIGTIGIAATQINVIVTTILATGTIVGAVSWLTFAFRLFQFPVGILSVSIAGSNLVHFSEAWKNEDRAKAISYLSTSYFLSFLTIIPAMALLFALAKESVHLVFERGAFSSSDTSMTYTALKFYLIGLPSYGLYKILTPTFFTLDKPKIPVKISVFAIVSNIIFCVYFTPKYGFWVLALGTSLSMILNSSIQAICLKRLLNIPWSFFFKVRILKLIIAGLITYVATLQASSYLFNYNDSFLEKSLMFCLSGALGALCYGLVIGLLGEGRELLKVIKRK
jgi:putative peptidoglycan lipid II flippase